MRKAGEIAGRQPMPEPAQLFAVTEQWRWEGMLRLANLGIAAISPLFLAALGWCIPVSRFDRSPDSVSGVPDEHDLINGYEVTLVAD